MEDTPPFWEDEPPFREDKPLPTPRSEGEKGEKCDFQKGEAGRINPRSRERDGALLSTGSTPGGTEES